MDGQWTTRKDEEGGRGNVRRARGGQLNKRGGGGQRTTGRWSEEEDQELGCASFFSVPDWPHFLESSDFLGLLRIPRNTRQN